MRIRSIKPEFWRSDDIAALAVEDRLLFIGLWSYVDDDGVGLDKLPAIVADLFAHDLERDAPETFARVSRGLQNLADRSLLIRYTVDGKGYLAVTGWAKHQRVDKPNKSRYPASDQGIATTSGEPRESVATVSRLEQRNRGTEEQSSSRTAGRGSRLPQGWHPGDSVMVEAVRLGPALDVQVELAKFNDYWAAASGAKGVKADWGATWRNWVRNAQQRAEERGWKPQAAVEPGFEWMQR